LLSSGLQATFRYKRRSGFPERCFFLLWNPAILFALAAPTIERFGSGFPWVVVALLATAPRQSPIMGDGGLGFSDHIPYSLNGF
jgi:hypothetical protein